MQSQHVKFGLAALYVAAAVSIIVRFGLGHPGVGAGFATAVGLFASAHYPGALQRSGPMLVVVALVGLQAKALRSYQALASPGVEVAVAVVVALCLTVTMLVSEKFGRRVRTLGVGLGSATCLASLALQPEMAFAMVLAAIAFGSYLDEDVPSTSPKPFSQLATALGAMIAVTTTVGTTGTYRSMALAEKDQNSVEQRLARKDIRVPSFREGIFVLVIPDCPACKMAKEYMANRGKKWTVLPPCSTVTSATAECWDTTQAGIAAPSVVSITRAEVVVREIGFSQTKWDQIQ